MTNLFLRLDDAVRVAEIQFDIEPAIARVMFEQKCYIPDDQYKIGYQDGLADAIKAVEAWNRRAECTGQV